MCPSLVATALSVIAVGFVADSGVARQLDLVEVLSPDGLHRDHALVHAGGEVPFAADAWALPGAASAPRLLLGISLSNEALEFHRATTGWRARYRVEVELSLDGGTAFDAAWDKSLEISTFDETLLTGETIVFQTEIPLPPGGYELTLTVRDRNARNASRAGATVEIPRLPPGRPALGEPVLLRRHREGDPDRFVVHPTHHYPSAPERIEFLAELAGANPEEGPWELRARLLSRAGSAERARAGWSRRVEPGPDGAARVFGSVEDPAARFGEHALELVLADSAGRIVARAETPLLIAGSAEWLVENWEQAVSLIRYEALPEEVDLLEDLEDPDDRIEAWSCFWEIRDPAPGSVENEALQRYLRDLRTARERWGVGAGFGSDRGEVYLVLGPPDDIVERPTRHAPRPYEVWVYLGRGVRIVFVDEIGFGDYRVANLHTYQRARMELERSKRSRLRGRAERCPALASAYE